MVFSFWLFLLGFLMTMFMCNVVDFTMNELSYKQRTILVEGNIINSLIVGLEYGITTFETLHALFLLILTIVLVISIRYSFVKRAENIKEDK